MSERGGTVGLHTEHGGKRAEVNGPALEELVEQLSFNIGDHVDDHADNVGVLKTSTVPAGTVEGKIKGSRALGGAHVEAVEVESKDGRV